ncbi:MAG: PHP domain-containing protein [Actinobacteria bacterium]|jgi:predicted metal-dependent phosphoesterase TrpH|nr:PHP domain-containing protein [Actinomycetota bacterium]MCL6104031.1 PHP domain-containing protein [Actinomycetota bacterium]
MIDLHTHSIISDGTDKPAQIVELAWQAGLKAIALTDHDTTEGIAEAAKKAHQLGITFLAGCEISCRWSTGTMHLLVYFPTDRSDNDDTTSPLSTGPFADELLKLQKDRIQRNRLIIDRLISLGLPITWEEVVQEANGGLIGRPHFAKVLVKNKAVANMTEAFELWLGKGRLAYIKKARLLPEEIIRLAHSSKGIVSLAHPYSLGADASGLELAVRELASLGLSGIEAYYSTYSVRERLNLVEIAEKNGLIPTGGSDYHGDYKPDIKIGVGRGDLCVPESVLEELLEKGSQRF